MDHISPSKQQRNIVQLCTSWTWDSCWDAASGAAPEDSGHWENFFIWTYYENCKKIIPIWLAIKGCKRGAFILSIKYFCHDCMIGNKVFAVSFIIPLERGNRVQIKTSPIYNMHRPNCPTFKASPFSFFMNIWLYPRLYFAERQQREVSPFSVRIVFPQRIHFNSSNRIHVSPSTFRTKKL